MKKRLFMLFLLLFAGAAALQAAAARVLILYDQGEDRRQPALTEARYLANLLGHFDASVRVSPMAEYKAGDLQHNNVVFYVNYEKKYSLPADFKADFYKNDRTFCWLNHQLGELDQKFLKTACGFHFSEFRENTGFDKVLYKDVTFPKGDDSVNFVTVDDPGRVKVVATMLHPDGRQAPYIVRSRNLWFVADSPFSYFTEQDRYIVFADILHDILGQDHPASHTALVRIEDVNPSSDPDDLLRIARYLSAKNIPFAVSLVPIYIDPAKRVEYHLEDMPKMLAALKKIPSLGGVFIMHGYTHQYRGVTTDDYEFWDEVADKPVRGDSVENSSLRIEKSLKEYFSNGLYPVAWETPHYFASRNTYSAVKKYFSVVYDRRGVMDYLGSDQFFPYPVTDIYGQRVIPENLGYLHVDEPDPRGIIDAAKLNLAVRDGYASFFFHPFVNIKHLKQIVKELKKMGYTFADVRQFAPRVASRDKAVLTADASVRIDTQEKYVSVRRYDVRGNEVEENIVPHTPGTSYTADIKCPKGSYVVVRPQNELEPGLFKRIWRQAKSDVSHFGRKKQEKSLGHLARIMDVAVVSPAGAVRSPEEMNSFRSLLFSLNVAGVRFTDLPVKDLAVKDLREYDIIVLPLAAAKALKEKDVLQIKEAVSSGSDIVLEGPTKVSETLGIDLTEEPVTVRRVRDSLFPEVAIYWPLSADVKPVSRTTEKDYRVLCSDEETNAPLAVSGAYGKGNFIYLATLFDPYTDRGYSRFPFLLEMLDTVFDHTILAERKSVEMYFDPGLRQFISIEKLVKIWRRNGINTIYAGGWHSYDKYTYDYARLIRVCHENGILVYCWLEPPMVSQKFWNKHPEWREKTALLQDGKVGWRSLMNFADKDCRAKVFSETEALLTKYDWDGVNLAEFYFESSGGPAHPEIFTPMNDTVRREFRKMHGFDPLEIFDQNSIHFWKNSPEDWRKLAAYRKDLCYRLKAAYLDMLKGVKKKKKDFEVMVTAIDTEMEPSLGDYLAQDTGKLLALQKKYGFTLQVEDPSMFWSGKPERYETLGNYYRRFIKEKNRLVLDCNVLDNHKKGFGGLCAEKPTGEEMRQIAYNMNLSGSRAAFYSEDSVYENDYRNIAAVLARQANVQREGDMQWRVDTPSMVSLRTGKKDLITRLDGELWFAADGESVIVPAGSHSLEFETESRYFDMSSIKPRLNYISGELKGANFYNNAIELSYDSGEAPCYAVVSKRPGRLYVDGKRASLNVLEGDNGFSVKLPAGIHAVKINVGSGLSDLVETSGVVLLSLIIIFGFVTSVLLLGLFIAIQVKRKFAL
jgi:uncharacterized protein YdaL